MQTGPATAECRHETLGRYIFVVGPSSDGETPELLFTENETNSWVGFKIGR